ncbi:MAG TPA: exosortase A [Gammaproteobacteria bacterium]|nr:exosortase A [Gammaproteobacteria bacterium]
MNRVTLEKAAVAEQVTIDRPVSWRQAGAGFAAAAAVLIALYWTTVVSLVTAWEHTGMFQYAFLIFPVCVWLAWSKRHELTAGYAPRVCPWALPLLAATVFVWFLGRIANVDIVQQVAFVGTFPILVLLFFGTAVTRALAFPLAYLVFAIPFGFLHSMVGPLQTFTAVFSVKALHLMGTPVLLQGHSIMTPWMTANVEEACSGVRFFLACTALGILFAYLMFNSIWRRVGFVIASMIVPIIANGLRVYFTILIGGTFGVQYAEGTDHMIFGWQFFGTVLFLLLLAGWFLREEPRELPARGGRTADASWQRVIPAGVVALALLVAAPASAAWMQSRVPSQPVQSLSLPGAGGWALRSNADAGAWHPAYAGADTRIEGTYARDNGWRVDLYAAIYHGAQVDGHDLLAYHNRLYDADHYILAGSSTRTLTLPGGDRLTVREIRLGSRFDRRIVWYWYGVNGRTLTSRVRVRGWQAWAQLSGAGLTSSVVAVSTDYRPGGRQRAEAALANLTKTLYPQLERRLAMP